MTKFLLIALGCGLLAAAFSLGIADYPENHMRLALVCCVAAAILFAGCFPGSHGGRAA